MVVVETTLSKSKTGRRRQTPLRQQRRWKKMPSKTTFASSPSSSSSKVFLWGRDTSEREKIRDDKTKKKTRLRRRRPLSLYARRRDRSRRSFSRETRGRGNVLFETVVVFRVFGHGIAGRRRTSSFPVSSFDFVVRERRKEEIKMESKMSSYRHRILPFAFIEASFEDSKREREREREKEHEDTRAAAVIVVMQMGDNNNTTTPTNVVNPGGHGEKQAEIYTHEAPWLIYACNWSVRFFEREREREQKS